MRADAGLAPSSPSDARLVELVRPPGHVNPEPLPKYDLVVIGGGTAGIVAAIGAGVLGARVALVERRLLGGDCLNFGCVPSKALLRAASRLYDARALAAEAPIDFAAVMEGMRETRAQIAVHDAVSQLASFGVQVFFGEGRFVARDAMQVGGARLPFRRAIIATGSRPAVPPVPGLREAGFHTNETFFSIVEKPRRLVVLGGGPVGCELAQAFRRFGSEVTLVQSGPRLLPREDEDVSALLRMRLAAEGVRVLEQASLARVEVREGVRTLFLSGGQSVEGDALLVAIGRAPDVEGLDLERAGITCDVHGVCVDDRLRTKNPRVFAAGDVASSFKFTHAADALARIALQNALFFLRQRASALVIPWCTFTDPEIAHVGITSREASARRATTTTLTLGEIDRPILDGDGPGLARVHTDRGGRILGATLVGRNAGEALGPVVLAMTRGLRLRDLAQTIAPYPTRLEVWKRIADQHALAGFSPVARTAVRRVLALLR